MVGLAEPAGRIGWSAGSRSGSRPPSLESRRRYLLDRARARGLALPAEVLEPLAESADGYRTLDGWLAQLALASRVDRQRGRRRTWSRRSSGATRSAAPGLEEIARGVAEEVRPDGPRPPKGATRRAVVAEGRHLAMYLARRHTSLSFRAIGAYFGSRDPATVRHACAAAAGRIAADPALLAAAEALARGWGRAPGDGR